MRVAAFTIPRHKVKAFYYEDHNRHSYRFKLDSWVLPDDWEFGQNEKIRARFVRVAPANAVESHATQEA